MRPVTEIIIHCSATRSDWLEGRSMAEKTAEIRRWHIGNGWSDIGYHFLCDRDGTEAFGRPISKTGAHTRGRNTGSIGLCILGGHGSSEKDDFETHFTPEQGDWLRAKIRELRDMFPSITKISGHNEYAAKACPGFNVADWLGDATAPKLVLSNPAYPTIRAGSPATFVKALQERLTDLGYQLGEIDGKFGPATRTSVVSFQLANDLVSDGIAGPKTWAALLEQGRAKQIDIDRRMAGLDTLRDKGSETIKHADSTRVVGGATGLLGGVAAVATASEQIEGAAGSLGASVAAVQPMLDTITSSLPLVLIGGGVAVYWLATRIQSARLNDHRSGANMGR